MSEWALPIIYIDRCNGCGLCVVHCPTDAVEIIDAHPNIARPSDCAYCELCEDMCPEGAIELSYEIGFSQSPAEGG